ncbi:MAG TPA: hypothetical protein VGM99_00295 [Candidatus Cybelea sp.]
MTPPGATVPAAAATQRTAARLPWLATRLLARPDAAHSWMTPDAKKRALVYVSDDTTYDVYVFTYPQGKLAGTLTGFSAPGGLCSDSKGDVFIPNTLGSTILEYAHGGANPIATFNDRQGAYPGSCDVNPITGELAVANTGSGNPTRPGDIAIFRGASGTPSFYKVMGHPYSCAYDPAGNLFVDGEDVSFDNFAFGELKALRKGYHKIVLNQPISLAGGVAWDGTSVAVGDVYNAVIYRFSVGGSNGNLTGSTPLSGAVATWQFDLDRGRTVVPNSNTQDESASAVLRYSYPGGGAALKTFGGGIVSNPVGAAISRPQ